MYIFSTRDIKADMLGAMLRQAEALWLVDGGPK
jgi:hypothetical protein